MQDTAQSRYSRLAIEREGFLRRARAAASLTIPALVPPEGHDGKEDLPQPWQSLGARGVNNLSSKLLLALLPPGSSFFRLSMSDKDVEQLAKNLNLKSQFDQALVRVEQLVRRSVETSTIRVALFEALKQLLVAGNVLMHFGDDGNLRVFPLDSYVTVRDGAGTLLEIVLRERLSRETLPAEAAAILESAPAAPTSSANGGASGATVNAVDLYTRIFRVDDEYHVQQEVAGAIIPGSSGHYAAGELPWLALRFTRLDQEHYGRSYVEEYSGDLRSLDNLSKAIDLAAAASARVLFLVNPNGVTNPADLEEGRSGDVRVGLATDVTVLQVQKHADMQVALAKARELEQRLAFAFLLNTAIQRNGERVTAEEVRYMAQELDTALGGIYAVLSQELQLPLVRLLLRQLRRRGEIDATTARTLTRFTEPVIVTGLEALGRGNDINRLNAFLSTLGQVFGPEALASIIRVEEYVTRLANAYAIDPTNLVKTREEIQAEQQAAQQAQMAQEVAPEAVRQVGQAITQGARPAQ